MACGNSSVLLVLSSVDEGITMLSSESILFLVVITPIRFGRCGLLVEAAAGPRKVTELSTKESLDSLVLSGGRRTVGRGLMEARILESEKN